MKEKQYRCKECEKEYVYAGWYRRHSIKTKHYKFEKLKSEEFAWKSSH